MGKEPLRISQSSSLMSDFMTSGNASKQQDAFFQDLCFSSIWFIRRVLPVGRNIPGLSTGPSHYLSDGVHSVSQCVPASYLSAAARKSDSASCIPTRSSQSDFVNCVTEAKFMQRRGPIHAGHEKACATAPLWACIIQMWKETLLVRLFHNQSKANWLKSVCAWVCACMCACVRESDHRVVLSGSQWLLACGSIEALECDLWFE